jgi:hypothetical protein
MPKNVRSGPTCVCSDELDTFAPGDAEASAGAWPRELLEQAAVSVSARPSQNREHPAKQHKIRAMQKPPL